MDVAQIAYFMAFEKTIFLHRDFSHWDSFGKPGEQRQPKAKGLQPLKY